MKKPFIALCLCISLFSCKNEEKTNENISNIKISSGNSQPPFDQLKYQIIFPDTVIKNKMYKATIKFESDFDHIIDPIQINSALKDTTKTRVITFYRFKPFKATIETKNDLVITDTTFVLNKIFDIENIVFKEKGEYVFCGLIEDRIMYNYYNEKGIRDSVHFERRKQQIFKKVVVVE